MRSEALQLARISAVPWHVNNTDVTAETETRQDASVARRDGLTYGLVTELETLG